MIVVVAVDNLTIAAGTLPLRRSDRIEERATFAGAVNAAPAACIGGSAARARRGSAFAPALLQVAARGCSRRRRQRVSRFVAPAIVAAQHHRGCGRPAKDARGDHRNDRGIALAAAVVDSLSVEERLVVGRGHAAAGEERSARAVVVGSASDSDRSMPGRSTGCAPCTTHRLGKGPGRNMLVANKGIVPLPPTSAAL
jgi:hypothetical protein